MPAYSPRAAAQVFSACAEVVPEDKQGIPLLEVQAGHELRVTEVAVEFIRAGFTWVPALATGKGSSKISDGVAWLGDYRIEVEIELSAKNNHGGKALSTAIEINKKPHHLESVTSLEMMGYDAAFVTLWPQRKPQDIGTWE